MGGPAEAPGLPGPDSGATRPSGGGSDLGPTMPGLHPLSLSLLIYEMGVLAGRISWSIMCSACGSSEVLPACLPCWREVTPCAPAALGKDRGGE